MKLTAYCYGRTELPERMAFPGGNPDVKLPISLLFFLLETEDRKILIDVGCDTMPGFPLFSFEPPADLLRRSGVRPEEITDAIITHAHGDHIDAVRHYPQARIHIHENELPAAQEWLSENMNIHPFREEFAPVEHVIIRPVCGHSSGSSIVLLETPRGTLVLCGDECYTRRNLTEKIPTGTSRHPENSRAFINEYVKPEYTAILFHDPNLMDGLGWKVFL